MPNFKPKANKKIKIDKKSTITLDSKHNEKMLEFHNIKEIVIPELYAKKKILKKKLKSVENIVEKLAIKDEINDIKKKIFELKKKKDEYFL